VIAVYLNLLQTKRRLLHLKTQSVPRSKHLSPSVIKTNQFMFYVEVAVCSEVNTKQIKQCGQNISS